MTTRTSILLVEDDSEISQLITQYLQKHDMDVVAVSDSQAMDQALANSAFDLLLLDLNLPGEDGFSICRRVRARQSLPIIIVTAKAEDVDKILGLEMGADDYVVKPFNSRELLARIRAVLRRAEGQNRVGASQPRQTYHFAGWRMELLSREVVSPRGIKIAMTGAEFDLLHALCENPNRILTRDQLINLTHGPTSGPFERSVDVLISRLRQKLEKDPKNPAIILTVRSEGYLFAASVARA